MNRTDGSVLIIGGTGFIGRALARRLARDGRSVHVLSRHGREDDAPDGITVHRADQADAQRVAPLLAECRTVFHLAAATTPADTVWSPTREAEENILPTLRFLECAQGFPDNRYIFLSTGGALYGNAQQADEETPAHPASYHGASKLALEHFFNVLGQRHPGALSILRPSNVYGPGQSARPGFGIIPTLFARARDGGRVTVYGDGSAVRDYLFIDDLIDACLLAMHGPAGTYNIGAGKGHSLMELLGVIERVTGRPLAVDHQPARASDVGRIMLDVRRAQERLGWQAKVGLEQGIRESWSAFPGPGLRRDDGAGSSFRRKPESRNGFRGIRP